MVLSSFSRPQSNRHECLAARGESAQQNKGWKQKELHGHHGCEEDTDRSQKANQYSETTTRGRISRDSKKEKLKNRNRYEHEVNHHTRSERQGCPSVNFLTWFVTPSSQHALSREATGRNASGDSLSGLL
jgi:hypothetical protein